MLQRLETENLSKDSKMDVHMFLYDRTKLEIDFMLKLEMGLD